MPFGFGDNYGNGNGGGGIFRWVIGLVIALVGVITYYRTTTKNPVTGEIQHVALTPQQEMSLGLQTPAHGRGDGRRSEPRRPDGPTGQ